LNKEGARRLEERILYLTMASEGSQWMLLTEKKGISVCTVRKEKETQHSSNICIKAMSHERK